MVQTVQNARTQPRASEQESRRTHRPILQTTQRSISTAAAATFNFVTIRWGTRCSSMSRDAFMIWGSAASQDVSQVPVPQAPNSKTQRLLCRTHWVSLAVLEARTGFEPACDGFANRCLTAWLPRRRGAKAGMPDDWDQGGNVWPTRFRHFPFHFFLGVSGSSSARYERMASSNDFSSMPTSPKMLDALGGGTEKMDAGRDAA